MERISILHECNVTHERAGRHETDLAYIMKQRAKEELYLRCCKSAFSAELFALNALWLGRVTLDLLLSAGCTRNCKSLSRLARLGDTPLRIDGFSINNLLTRRPIFIHPARAFPRYILFTHDPRLRLDIARCAGWTVLGRHLNAS